MNNCGSVHSFKELFTQTQSGSRKWQLTEFYFFRCFARFTFHFHCNGRIMNIMFQIPPVCASARPCSSSRHELRALRTLPRLCPAHASPCHRVERECRHWVPMASRCQKRSGEFGERERVGPHQKWTLASNGLDTIESCAATVEMMRWNGQILRS